MYLKVSEYLDAHPSCDNIPYRLLDPRTGNLIGGVLEFDDDEGWLRVLCRSENRNPKSDEYFAYSPNGLDELVTQILTLPFQVVPWYDGIDDLPIVYVDTVEYNGGNPVGPWIPASESCRPVVDSRGSRDRRSSS